MTTDPNLPAPERCPIHIDTPDTDGSGYGFTGLITCGFCDSLGYLCVEWTYYLDPPDLDVHDTPVGSPGSG